LWIIAFGTYGIVGLISVTAVLLLPAVAFCLSRYGAADYWSYAKIAPVAVLAVVLTLYMLDCTLNGLVNPVYTLASGGLSGLLLADKETGKIASDRSSLTLSYINNHRKRSSRKIISREL
jgi:hypothetical protein